MTDISITVDGETEKCETFYEAVRYITEHKSFKLPDCPECKECNWKTWPGNAYCRECGHLFDNETFNGLMGFNV